MELIHIFGKMLSLSSKDIFLLVKDMSACTFSTLHINNLLPEYNERWNPYNLCIPHNLWIAHKLLLPSGINYIIYPCQTNSQCRVRLPCVFFFNNPPTGVERIDMTSVCLWQNMHFLQSGLLLWLWVPSNMSAQLIMLKRGNSVNTVCIWIFSADAPGHTFLKCRHHDHLQFGISLSCLTGI